MPSPRVEFEFDIAKHAQIMAALAALGDDMVPSMEAVLTEEAEDIIAAANELVPADIGNLKGAKFVEAPNVLGGDVTVEFGYGNTATLYAKSVHENQRSGQTGGRTPSGGKRKTYAKVGEWKFLETPFVASTAGWLDRIGTALWARVRR